MGESMMGIAAFATEEVTEKAKNAIHDHIRNNISPSGALFLFCD
jgi:hypothetical protein